MRDAHTGALEALDRILNRGGDADDVLRAVVAIVHQQLGRAVAISFVEAGGRARGPACGQSAGDDLETFTIVFQGRHVADLEVGGPPLASHDRSFLERVALLASPYALVGWDTGGEAWTPY